MSHFNEINGLVTSPDDKAIVSAGAWDGLAFVWDATKMVSRKMILPLPGEARYHSGYVRALAYSPDGRRIAMAIVDHDPNEDGEENERQGGQVLIYDLERETVALTIDAPGGANHVAYSPDGHHLLVAGYRCARLVDAASGQELASLPGGSPAVTTVAFRPDGRVAVTGGSQGTVEAWELPAGRRLRGFPALPRRVNALAFSPDGKHLVAGGARRALRWWHADDARVLLAEEDDPSSRDQEQVRALVFSRDGRWLYSVGSYLPQGSVNNEGELRAWDVGTQKLRHRATTDTPLASGALSPDGRGVTAGDFFGKLWRWDREAKAPQVLVESGFNERLGFQLSPDGRFIAIRRDPEPAIIREVATGRLTTRFSDLAEPFPGLNVSPNGRRFFAFTGDAQQLLLHDLDAGRRTVLWNAPPQTGSDPAQVRQRYQESLKDLRFSADGKLILAFSLTGGFRWWDATTGSLISKVLGDEDFSFTTKQFSPHGRYVVSLPSRLASEGVDSTGNTTFRYAVQILEPSDGTRLHTVAEQLPSQPMIAFSPDDRLLAIAAELPLLSGRTATKRFTVQLVELATGQIRATLARDQEWLRFLTFSPDGKWLMAGVDDTSALAWDVASGTLAFKLNPNGPSGTPRNPMTQGGAFWPVFSPDGHMLAWTGNRNQVETLYVWDLTRRALRLASRHKAVIPLMFTPDGQRLFSYDRDGHVTVWDTSLGKELLTFAQFPDGEWIAFTPDGRFDGSPKATHRVGWRQGTDLYPFSRLDARYHIPGLWGMAWSGTQLPPIP